MSSNISFWHRITVHSRSIGSRNRSSVKRPTVGFGSKSAVPPTTEHSRSTLNCGRTAALAKPSRKRQTPLPERNTTSCNILKERAAQERKIVVPPHIPLDFPRHRKHCCPCRRPPPGSPPAWPRAPGLWWCKHRDRRDADPEDEDDGQQTTPQASKERRKGRYRRDEQAGSQTASAQPRRRVSQARSGSAATETSSAAAQAAWLPKEPPRASTLSKTTLGRRGSSCHNPSLHRRAPICRPPMFPVLTLIDRGRAQSARC